MFYLVNAIACKNMSPVGLIVEASEKPTLSELQTLFPDKYDFREVGYHPVWVPELFPVWSKWKCLHKEGALDLAPFPVHPRKRHWQKIRVSVPYLFADYNPLRLAPYIWGCDSFTLDKSVPAEVTKILATMQLGDVHVRYGSNAWHWHAARILYLANNPTPDPIMLCTDYPLVGQRVTIEEGHHRFMAAVWLEKPYIDVLPIGDVSCIIRNYGYSI